MREEYDTQGIPPSELSDEDLARELNSLHRTREDTLRHGPDPALVQHDRRTAELEDEYLRRCPDREVTRSRSASRASRGQPTSQASGGSAPRASRGRPAPPALDPEADPGPDFAEEHNSPTFAGEEPGGLERVREPESPHGLSGMDKPRF